MHKLLKEISVISGVAGSCIYNKKNGILSQETNEQLTAELLKDTAVHLTRLLQMGKMSGLKINTVHFYFDRYAVVGLPFQDDSVFLAVCSPKTDCCHVAAKSTLLLEELPEQLDNENLIEEIEEIEPYSVDSAELEAMFNRIEQALAGAIGPVAGMVMQDYINRWRQDGPAVTTRIVELTNLLVDEIGEPEVAQEFISKIEEII
ncbi:MAG: hypothetical protein D3923_06975 [Candidatus Electrothrix sp. AR3]|nr:hypothetical protein [Candidatus Electrothrix sp. AR3]